MWPARPTEGWRDHEVMVSPASYRTGERGMTQSVGSTARILAAGLALASGYGAAAYSTQAQTASIRAPAVFGKITPETVAGFEGAVARLEANASSALAAQTPSLPAARGPLRSGALGEFAARGGMQLVSLEWAAVPALPKPLSAPEAGDPSRLIAPLTEKDPKKQHTGSAMPVLETLAERMGVGGLGAQLIEDARLFAAKRQKSAPARLPMSRSRQMRHPFSQPGDAVAVLPYDELAALEFILPFASGRVTSLFNDGRRHPAIDLAGKLGSPVSATTSRQRVVFAGWRGGYGNAVITQDVYGRTHLYGHLQSITSRVGQMLDQGEKLGHLGSTGHSTGPHVHYEVRNSKGVHINPMVLLFPGRSVGKGYAWLDPRQEGVIARVAARTR
jgi:murein DD-endopeptidase MepM/ murein hydrolase activator NlpD